MAGRLSEAGTEIKVPAWTVFYSINEVRALGTRVLLIGISNVTKMQFHCGRGLIGVALFQSVIDALMIFQTAFENTGNISGNLAAGLPEHL
jgi:hypothetical protein